MDELEFYDYDLPRTAIAQEPLPCRSDARLLVYERQSSQVEHRHVRDLPEILRPGDCVVVNDTRVVPARLVGYRERTRGRWQGLYLRNEPASGLWAVLSKTRGRLETGERIIVEDREARPGLDLEVVARLEGGQLLVRPSAPAQPSATTEQMLERFGRVPLPPYIRDGRMVDSDVQRYQTVYARAAGSVAAPTAGLHLTNELLAALRKTGIELATVTLHVGLGTFRPIQTDRISEHVMHAEDAVVTAETAEQLNRVRNAGGRIIAVGTTSTRVLESAITERGFAPFCGPTDLFIRPPYQFRGIDGLMTNFHLPRSSLLVMLSALVGRERLLELYQLAIREGYRFYSYGDAMLVL